MNHFKLELIIKDYIANFDKDKLKIELSDITLLNPENDKKTSFPNKRFFILYKRLTYPIILNIYVLNNSKNPSERIDYLLDEDFEIENIVIDLYYGDIEIQNYSFNNKIGEQVDLIEEIKRNNVLDISYNKSFNVETVNKDLELILIPMDYDNTYLNNLTICINHNDLIYNIDYKNKHSLSIRDKKLLKKFNKVAIFLCSKKSPIVLKDLERLNINISNMLKLTFNSIQNGNNISYNINKTGTLNEIYNSFYFNYNLIKSIRLGYIYLKNDIFLFEPNVKLYSITKDDL